MIRRHRNDGTMGYRCCPEIVQDAAWRRGCSGSVDPCGSWLAVCAQPSRAAETAAAQAAINAGDTAWVLISAALVMLMTPALAFFYGGLVRRKNMLSVLMQCLMILCLISLQWVVFGYSLSFGPDKGSLIGWLNWAFLQGRGDAAERRLCGHDPAPGIHDVPDDVRRDYAGADHRRVRGADEVLRVVRVHAAVGDVRVRSRWPTGSGASAAS